MEENTSKVEQLKGKFETEYELDIALSLIEIYEENRKNFRKNILLSGILPEPLSFDIDKKLDRIEKFYEASKLSKDIVYIKEKDYKEDFIKQINNILKTYEIIKNYGISNRSIFNTCKFREYSKERQIQMICLFIEDQMNLARTNSFKNSDKNGNFFTGMEGNLPLNVDGNDIYRMSASDNIEAYINAAEEMIRYIFYINKKCMSNVVTDLNIDANPYYNPDFEKIMYLASHRAVLKDMWDKVKYRNWILNLIKDEKNNNVYCFVPNDIERYKKEKASLERASYRDLQRVMKGMTISNMISDNIFEIISKLKIEKIKDIFSLDINIINNLFNSLDVSMKEYMYFLNLFYGDKLLNLQIKENITFSMAIDTIKYLYSIASIGNIINKRQDIQDKFNQENEYLDIAPIIDIKMMANQLSSILNISERLAKECLNIFIFSPNNKLINLDLFSQPLIYISKEQVVFTPVLILQMNIERILEKILSKTENNISDKGTNMEAYMVENINKSPYIEVNTNNIKFNAYDGKDVEFDFLGIFEEKLVLMEMKCRTTPYSSKEIMEKESVLQEVVEQVNRRVNVIQNNWDEIKKRSTIKLMDTPPNESDIIKIGCFNFINFTGLNIDGVYISDCSAIIKYFTQPINYATVVEKSKIVRYPAENLWKGDFPTINNFEKFLQMPNMLKMFYDKMDYLLKPVMQISEEDEILFFIDYYLSENPVTNYIHIGKDNPSNRVKSSKIISRKQKKKQIKKSKKKNRKNKS